MGSHTIPSFSNRSIKTWKLCGARCRVPHLRFPRRTISYSALSCNDATATIRGAHFALADSEFHTRRENGITSRLWIRSSLIMFLSIIATPRNKSPHVVYPHGAYHRGHSSGLPTHFLTLVAAGCS